MRPLHITELSLFVCHITSSALPCTMHGIHCKPDDHHALAVFWFGQYKTSCTSTWAVSELTIISEAKRHMSGILDRPTVFPIWLPPVALWKLKKVSTRPVLCWRFVSAITHLFHRAYVFMSSEIRTGEAEQQELECQALFFVCSNVKLQVYKREEKQSIMVQKQRSLNINIYI